MKQKLLPEVKDDVVVVGDGGAYLVSPKGDGVVMLPRAGKLKVPTVAYPDDVRAEQRLCGLLLTVASQGSMPVVEHYEGRKERAVVSLWTRMELGFGYPSEIVPPGLVIEVDEGAGVVVAGEGGSEGYVVHVPSGVRGVWVGHKPVPKADWPVPDAL